MTVAEALTGILSLVGAGGLTSIVVGYLAFKTEASKGRREPMKSADLPANGTFPGNHDFELLVNALTMLTGLVNRFVAILEQVEKRHAVDEEVEKALRDREMRQVIEMVRGERAQARTERAP